MKPPRKRNKLYRPRHVQIPIMGDLQTAFMIAGHGALASMRIAPNSDACDQLAGLFNVIYLALQATGRRSVVLESGMRALSDVIAREERIGVLALAEYDTPPLQNAVVECEQLIRELDVITLHLAQRKSSLLARMDRLATPTEPVGSHA